MNWKSANDRAQGYKKKITSDSPEANENLANDSPKAFITESTVAQARSRAQLEKKRAQNSIKMAQHPQTTRSHPNRQ